VNHNVQGNPDLDAENSHNVNLSLQYNRETSKSFVGTEINFFYNSINDIITLAQAEGDLYTYINVDKYITQGTQLVINYRLYPWFNIKTGGGITGRYNSLSEDDGTDKKFQYTPDAVLTTTYRWLKTDMDFTLNYKFTGRMPQFFVNESGQVSEGYISAYHTMDFTLQKSFFRNRLTIGAGVKNILNNTTVAAVGSDGGVHTGGGGGGYPVGWGRTFFIQAAVNLNKF
jgi:outer membrane receptor for ferrienterochelin and colicins